MLDDLDDLLDDEIEVEDDDETSDDLPSGQPTMFGSNDDFKPAYIEWKGMPEYSQNDLSPHASIVVHFRNEIDQRAFYELIGVDPVRPGRGANKSVWYPALEIASYADKRYRTVEPE